MNSAIQDYLGLILVIFIIFAMRTLSKLDSDGNKIKIATVVMSNWIGWTDLTSPAQKEIKEKGYFETWFSHFKAWYFLGIIEDDTIHSKGHRDGREISFKKDVKDAVDD